MTLITCPNCGKTVSSVASTCPQCATLLSQYRFMQGQSGSLTECRSCSRKVLSGAATCPYCGVLRPGRRAPYGVVGLVLALAVPIVVFAAIRSRTPEVRAPTVAPEVVLPQAVESSTAESSVAPPLSTAPRMLAGSQPPPAADARPPTTLTRWTNEWTNVRDGRGLDAGVVRVLRPGDEVQVGDRESGWWALYVDGRLAGYVAGSVLSDHAPVAAARDSVGHLDG